MSPSRLRPGALRKLSTAFVAALTVSLQLADFAHLAVEEHEVCAEHGQAVDTGRTAHAHGTPVASRAPAPTERAVRDGEGSAQGEHTHCPFVADHRDDAALVPEAYAVYLCSPEPVAVVVPDTSWTMTPSALRLRAPKTSPPA